MASSSAALIGGVYSIDFGHSLVQAAPGVTPFAAAAGGIGGFMAVPVERGRPARARALALLGGLTSRTLLTPLAHGPAATPAGDGGYFVICPAPPGPSLQASQQAWSEAELIEQIVKPAAAELAALQAKGITHRAIHAANLFQSARGAPVTLGCAWAAPPGSQQPGWVEPPYSAACLPHGRGEGTTADDIYALGAILLTLALGRNPVAGIPDDAVLHRKLDVGSYAALVGDHRLPSGIADLLRGMLADDPDHRPSPALLATPAAARARRIAARPIRRSQRPIEIGRLSAVTARTLAHALQREPTAGIAALRNGIVDRWLRRGLGDSNMAARMDEVVRIRDAQAGAGDARANPALLANAITVLDPAAPLVWRSVAVFPDGLGAALDHALHHAPDQAAPLAEIATAGVLEEWAAWRKEASPSQSDLETPDLRILHHVKAARGEPWRLCYALNPLSPCESPLLKRFWVTRLADLLPAMEASAATRAPDGQMFLDKHIADFVAVRRDDRLQGDLGLLATDLAPGDTLAQLRLIARMQAKLHPGQLPQLSAWAAEALQPLIQRFRSRSCRTRIAAALASLANAGQLTPMATLLEDGATVSSDREGCGAAAARLLAIDHRLAELADSEIGSADRARRLGHDVATGIGAITCLIALAAAMLT